MKLMDWPKTFNGIPQLILQIPDDMITVMTMANKKINYRQKKKKHKPFSYNWMYIPLKQQIRSFNPYPANVEDMVSS